ncbi:MAG: cytochrome c oxidase subunit [Solirubrobacteraceae bacterium]|nr:cytochrome c oxidase subunit [Solirubrobacteraceae bacterium]MEA2159481.1 cytochrome c oxidase subunit [Solirubrobacteraceae bacterium]
MNLPPALLTPGVVDTRREYRHVFSIYVPIAVGVFVVIVLITAAAVLRYRAREPERAARWHENNRLEGSYALVLALVCVFLLVVTFTAEHRVDTVANRQKPALTVEVTAAKWEWRFYYPAYGITLRSGTVGRQPLVVPTGEAIRFNLLSADVIHAFWIPEADYKHDLIPGSTQVTTLSFGRPGRFQGQCAEFCGLRHADMVFAVDAVTPARFAAWARAGGRSPAP